MRWYQRFFRRELTEKHLDAELRFHLEQQIADYMDWREIPLTLPMKIDHPEGMKAFSH